MSLEKFTGLSDVKKIHIIGVAGTLMGAFAAYLKRRGIDVTGSDQNVYPPMSDVLAKAGVKVFSPYTAENIAGLSPKPDLVVIGNVIQAVNPEARATIEGGLTYTSLPEAMEKLFLKDTRNLVVAGTHGKTTTSTMLSHVLNFCGQDPSYFFGGVSLDLPHSFHVTSLEAGRPFVLEGDEYDTAYWDKVPKFNHYLPNDVILTSVEFDHADIYPDLAAVERAFEGLLTRIRNEGRLIACVEYASVRQLLKKGLTKKGIEIITYGLNGNSEARYTLGRATAEGETSRFEVLDRGKAVDEIAIHIPGQHNQLNALAVWIECQRLGLDAAQVRTAFLNFKGVKRRQEVRGEVRGILVIDDFAHHPTAVRETLKALRLRYPGRRLVSVFEPRSATSRRKIFQQDYALAFGESDRIYISAPYDQTKIKADDQFSSDQLVADLVQSGKSAAVMPTVEDGVAAVAREAKSGDLIAVLSNGGFGGFIPKLLDALKG